MQFASQTYLLIEKENERKKEKGWNTKILFE
jgi:hypothetical protein